MLNLLKTQVNLCCSLCTLTLLNDEEIHAPSKQGANEGESWSVTAPTITGYDLEDPAQATVTGVASGSDHYIKQTVYYMPGYVTYTVKRMKETTGNYVEGPPEENYGVPDSIVTGLMSPIQVLYAQLQPSQGYRRWQGC